MANSDSSSSTIQSAALTGDRRLTLEAMRDKLARDMDDAPPSVVAQIAGRLSAILEELDDIGAAKGSVSDDLAKRRADRVAAAKQAVVAGGAGKQRRQRSS